MNRKVIFILVGGFLILVLIFVLWFWFFGRHDKSDVLPGGSLGSGQNIDGGTGGSGTGGNGQAPIGSNTGSGSTGGTGGSGSVNGQTPIYNPSTGSTSYTGTSYTTGNYLVNPPGTWWFDGSSNTYTIGSATGSLLILGSGSTTIIGGGTGSGFNFDQTPINTVNGGTVSGSPYIEPKVTGADGTDISLLSSLATVIGGCLITYAAQEVIIAPATTAVSAGVGSIGNFLAGLFGFDVSGTTPLNPLYTSDTTEQGKTSTETVSQCLTRTLGRLAVQKITDSTVAWINSGFDGQPAYVQDFNKFFTDVADEAAGAYIQSSDFAFLCSPFKLQVKIAIAQSYARRSSSPSCTLSQVTGNIDSFMKGNFSEGGWGSLISFTTQPSNNPYGAYITLQGGLQTAVGNAQANANLDLTLGQGFLSVKDKNGKITTPGHAFVSSFDATTQATLDSLQMGESIDQILGALSNALITKLLYNGLSTINQGDSSTQNKPTTKANKLMQEMQTYVSAAQQYATVEQRSIADIQNVQESLATLANCWSAATSTNLTPQETAQATAGYQDALGQITTLQTTVTQHNANITNANKSIVRLQNLQTDLLLATVAADVNKVENKLENTKTSGTPRLYTQADVTTATQDRTTLQTSLEQQTVLATAQLQQCYALRN